MTVTTFFYYIGTGKYCCIFIILLQVHIVVVQNSNVQGVSKKLMLYRVENTPYTNPKPKPTQ